VRAIVESLVIMLFVLPAREPLPAQQPPSVAAPRRGFYATVGAASGQAAENCTGAGCATTSVSYPGPAVTLAIGGSLSPHWAIGFEGDVWTNPQAVQGYTMAFYSAMIAYYPSRTSNLWIKVGPGYVTNSKDESGNGTSYGMTGGVGAGYDWMPTRRGFAVIPFATYLHQFSGNNVSHGSSAILMGNLFMLGVGFGYRH